MYYTIRSSATYPILYLKCIEEQILQMEELYNILQIKMLYFISQCIKKWIFPMYSIVQKEEYYTNIPLCATNKGALPLISLYP
jgi:hypothetical protein